MKKAFGIMKLFPLGNYLFVYLSLKLCCSASDISTSLSTISHDNSTGEPPESCEMFYEGPSTNDGETTGFCAKRGRNKYSLDSEKYRILRIFCHGDIYPQSESDQFTSNADTVLFINCPLTPTVFQKKILYPYIRHFSSKNNWNPILRNNTFHGICNVQIVRLIGNSIKTFQDSAFDCLEKIKVLDLSDNEIESLPVTVFIGMRYLETLVLQKNRLRVLNADIFDGLISLRKVSLNSNLISDLPSGIFRNLKELTVLYLGGNKLETLDSGLLSNSTKLNYLDLSSNQLKQLRNVFLNNSRLAFLSISGNSGIYLHRDVFSKLPGLNYLLMRNCNITTLHGDMFLSNADLSRIDVSNNHIRAITLRSFGTLKHLEVIDASFNSIAQLRDSPFRDFEYLNYLNLSGNSLPEIKEDDLIGLVQLLTLDLSANSIKRIADNSFDELTKLSTLNISHNNIASLSSYSGLRNLKKLRNLDLSRNHLKTFSADFSFNPRLRNLVLGKNADLVLTRNAFLGLHELEELHLEDCNLEHLPDGLFLSTGTLSRLSLSNNRLKEITPKTFSELQLLKNLDLSYNNITKLSDKPFSRNNKLSSINLSGNNLSEIERDNFYGLSSLEELDVSSNSILMVAEDSFDDMQILLNLNLSGNHITSLPGQRLFKYNERLITIDISHNNLTDFRNIEWQHLISLEELRVTNNEIKELFIPKTRAVDKDLIIHLEWNGIKIIYLEWNETGKNKRDVITKRKNDVSSSDAKIIYYMEGNPFQCDCHAYDIYMHLQDSTAVPRVMFMDDLICQNSYHNPGEKLLNLSEKDLVCYIYDFCPENCTCAFAKYNLESSVDCSNLGYEELPSQAPPNTNVLLMGQNKLRSLRPLEAPAWKNLEKINAEGNEIVSEEFYIPTNLKALYLKNNKLKILPQTIQKHVKRVEEFEISLSDNPWTCNCSALDLRMYLSDYKTEVIDGNDVRCIFPNNSQSNTSLLLMKEAELCPLPQLSDVSLVYYVISILLMLLLTTLIALYYRYKRNVLSFLYSYCHGFYVILCCDKPIDDDKVYDCFISYGSEDRDVALTILQELESKPPNYKFCIHERNWLPGPFIQTHIFNSVQSSRKTLIIVSETFLKSKWFHLEFQAAYTQTLEDRRNRLIIILKDDLPPDVELEKDVKFVISTRTYLKWGERWFWEKLRYAIHEKAAFVEEMHCWGISNACWAKDDATDQDISLNQIA